ncbi:MAG TPA: efflux RND transporter periplasmic adaptor subunit [Myxococcota bacterium]|nr:efflux RND transporter periplasmic adaptor subunit [Myxococcota bacterium]
MSELREDAPETTDVGTALGLGLGGQGARLRRIATLGGLGALALALLLVFALRGRGDGMRYKTQPARHGDLTVLVTATGTLQPTNQVDVSSQLSGTVRTVSVDYNDTVTVGQELAKLDTSKFEANVKQSQAALVSAKAKVEQAEATLAEAESQIKRLEHVRELSGGKVPSQADMDTANAALLSARGAVADTKAAVLQAQATLDSAQTDLGWATIRSPVNGIVLTRAVEPGNTVAASLQAPVLFTLAEDLTRMELIVSVDEADVGQVAEGQSAEFAVDAWPDRRFDAKVSQVRNGAKTVAGVVTYETVLQVDNSERLLRPGMTATAEITVKQLKNALLVPNAALRFAPPAQARSEGSSGGILRALIPTRRFGGPRPEAKPAEKKLGGPKTERVYELADGRPQALEVVPGSTDGSWTEVKSGKIDEGTELVVDAVAVKK